MSSLFGYLVIPDPIGDLFFKKKGAGCLASVPPFCFPVRLSAETKLLDDSPVSLDVNVLKIVQKLAALADQAKKRATCYNVLLVLLHVLCKVSDTVGK